MALGVLLLSEEEQTGVATGPKGRPAHQDVPNSNLASPQASCLSLSTMIINSDLLHRFVVRMFVEHPPFCSMCQSLDTGQSSPWGHYELESGGSMGWFSFWDQH